MPTYVCTRHDGHQSLEIVVSIKNSLTNKQKTKMVSQIIVKQDDKQVIINKKENMKLF